MSERGEQLLINVSDFETRVALLDGGQVQEVHLARANNYSLTGNIYLGRVERVMPGMQAAFVDVGLERPGFLHARDIDDRRSRLGEDPDESAAPDGHRDIRSLLRTGQEIMVQIAKDPISTKGARLTTQVAIASRYLVLTPFSEHIGISQRIDREEERDRLRDLIAKERVRQETPVGFIARTAAEDASPEALAADMRILNRMWDKVLKNRHASGCPGVVYQELPIHSRIVRDLATARLDAILIDHQSTFGRIRDFVAEFLPEAKGVVQRYDDSRPLFERFNVDEEIERALEPQVSLKSGGYLVIEQTEAMVSIDVNTGRFLGSSTLEETVFRTNLEAAQAVPRQLRLRNLGGIIVIDFIDMTDADHQRQVLRALERACELDPARTHIDGYSGFGLVQMSRKRTRESLQQQLCEPCPHCDGRGHTRTAATTCAAIFRAIIQDADGRRPSFTEAPDEYLIRASERVVERLLDEDAESLAQLSRLIGRQARLQVEPGYGPGEFDIALVQVLRR
ncbi:MAG: Rne/Rng family ribonuclease [Pseudomonadota bacterium]